MDTNNTSNVGLIQVTEKVSMGFMDFLRNDVANVLGVSVSNITFALKTFFSGQTENGSDIIHGNQYVFHVPQIVNSLNQYTGRPETHTLMTMGTAHTVGQLPSYSNLYQFTLTDAKSPIRTENPTPNPESCNLIMPRGAEDGMKYPPRTERLNKSANMKTLKEIFDAFQVDLDDQKNAHKGQVQSWMRYVRDDHVDKIGVPPIQKKVAKKGALPIKYHVTLDPQYHSYPVDNRNLPFEQPEQSQSTDGIRSINVAPSSTITQTAMMLCSLSTKIGDDALKPIPEIPKVSISTVVVDDTCHIYVKIYKCKNPLNSQSVDTGPGESAVEPMELVVHDAGNIDVDVLMVDAKLSYSTSTTVMETHPDSDDANVVYGDREQLTSEKEQKKDFFKTMFSGLRPMTSSRTCDGLENGVKGSAVDALNSTQFSAFNVEIKGNPYLMSDITNRKPLDVANHVAGVTHYYKFPEVYPIYAKLRIFEKTMSVLGNAPPTELEVEHVHYHTNHYHVSKMTNIFGGFDDMDDTRDFTQVLELRRTDDDM